MAGKLVHFEIPADETSRALGFYNQLFGWEFKEMGGPIEYHMAETAGTGVGLHSAAEGGGIEGIYVYFDVDDIDSGVERVKELGGQAEERAPVPGMGWFSRCKDTEGNQFALWQSDRSAA